MVFIFWMSSYYVKFQTFAELFIFLIHYIYNKKKSNIWVKLYILNKNNTLSLETLNRSICNLILLKNKIKFYFLTKNLTDFSRIKLLTVFFKLYKTIKTLSRWLNKWKKTSIISKKILSKFVTKAAFQQISSYFDWTLMTY